MSKAKTNNTYTVTARVVSIDSIEITSSSLTEAVEKSKNLSSEDFVTDVGEQLDGSYEVIGVSNNERWDTE